MKLKLLTCAPPFRLIQVIVLFIYFCLNTNSALAQQELLGKVWSNEKLEWNDFQENNSIEKEGKILARTYTKLFVANIDTLLHHERKSISVKVYALFIPNLSWVSAGALGKKSVLAHEQLHFDIVELMARRLRRALAEQKVTCKNYEKVIGKLERKAFSNLASMQREYDETHRTKWSHWVTMIEKELAALENYKSVDVSIALEV